MKKVLFSGLLAMVLTTAGAATYEIDPLHSNARFEIDHFGTSTNVGGVYEAKGVVEFDAQAQTGSVDVVLPLANLQSSSQAFTQHLKSADLFHADKFPEIRFQSQEWVFQQGKVAQVKGLLTLLGQTKPVTLQAKRFNCYQSPMKRTEVCGGDFVATIDRTQWGMDYLVKMGMSKEVSIAIQVEAVKK